MKRVAVLAILAAALGACQRSPDAIPAAPARAGARAGSTPEAAPAAVARDPLPHPLLWSVEKDGHTTYFFGTMHRGVDAASRLPAIVWNKLDAARAFAMEADLDDPALADAIRPTERSLRDTLGDTYWTKLEGAIGPGTARAVEHLPPLVSASALSMRGLPQTEAMDKVLSARAAGEHKPVVFLEPATRQLALLGKWMDTRALKMMLDELPEGEQHARAMLDAYVSGDERRIVTLADDERGDALRHGYTAAEYDREITELLYERNASWIAALEKLHEGGGGFVAVGTLHLVGPRSVLDLLARKGYRVTRLAP
ncbi:MAG TPA: TraB/GumN family protein [Kofleriaceae bacterium]